MIPNYSKYHSLNGVFFKHYTNDGTQKHFVIKKYRSFKNANKITLYKSISRTYQYTNKDAKSDTII